MLATPIRLRDTSAVAAANFVSIERSKYYLFSCVSIAPVRPVTSIIMLRFGREVTGAILYNLTQHIMSEIVFLNTHSPSLIP